MKKEKFSILYVDDEEINLRVFKTTFEDEFVVFTAKSGDEGVKIFEENEIDLIITDQRMPQMTGVEFLKKIIDLNPEPNRILLTGFSDIEALSSAVNEGKIYQYINKPWDEAELKPVIYQALESYYIKKENQMLNQALKNKNEMLEAEVAAKVALLEQLKASEQALRIAKERAEESDLLKTSFLNNMSHEIRTPLNGIIGFAELLCTEEFSSEEKMEFYNFIDQNSKDLLNMISNVILLSQLETGLLKPRNEVIDCQKFIQKQLKKFSSKIEDKRLNINFVCKLAETDMLFTSDEAKLTEIVCQLLDNAIKFTEKGTISIIIEKKDDKLKMSIKDTGIGIESKFQQVIFERFRKIEHSKSKLYRGNGLGLAIANAFALLLRGHLSVISEPGNGAEFVLELPFIETTDSKSKGIIDTKITAGGKILLVEDESDNIALIKSILKKAGMQLFIATDGLEAIEFCKKNQDLDLVLMDIRIPELDGFETTKQIKKFNPNLKVIAQTAYAFEDDAEKARLAGCDEFIVKPLTREKILKYFS